MSQSVQPEDLTTAPADVSLGSLWRDRNFLTMWSGQALSQFGAQITELALPVLAVLLLHATEFEIGVLNAAGTAAFLVVGLPAGAWIDRMRKRHVMIVADLVRALALASLPLLWVLGALQIWHMVAVALVMGIATVFFDVSYQSVIPSLVRPGQIAEANGKFETTAQLAGIAGPAAGGWLIGVITAPLAILVTAGTYVASMLALAFTRDHERVAPAAEHDPLARSIGEGLRWVFGNRYLRRIVGTTAVSNFFSTVTFTLMPIFLLRTLGITPEGLGLVFAVSSLGGVAGAMATPHIVRRLGEGPAIPIGAIAFSSIALLLPLAATFPDVAFPIVLVQGFVAMFSVLLYNITQVTFRQRITPPRLLGRMNASIRFCVWGVMPLAALTAGGLGTWLGTTATMWIGAVGSVASALFVVTGPFWTTRSLPDPGA
ncbi:MFS transporter [Microbacterium invictum]|uniref:MFS family permease n=1 Tax=Microbacterium invictum TaxID=515415 RepID=A0AA40VNJ0_9MICO|nr:MULTISPECIES: MFS transporter [Microbacterium]MBB4140914.1 MFS family permease [Microbacterium invictum]